MKLSCTPATDPEKFIWVDCRFCNMNFRGKCGPCAGQGMRVVGIMKEKTHE